MRLLIRAAVMMAFMLFAWQPSMIQAEDSWRIDRSHSVLEAKQDGLVSATETVRVDFGDNEVATLTKNIPLKYVYQDQTSFARVEVERVQRNQVDEPFEVRTHSNYVELIVGDERLTLKGEQEYQISYHLEGVLRDGDGIDQLVWFAAGGWSVPVVQATASVVLPVNSIGDTDCQVKRGDGEVQDGRCDSVVLADGQSRYVATSEVQAGGALLVSAEYEAGAIPFAQVQPTQLADWVEVYQRPLLFLGVASVVCVLLATGLWWFRRKYRSSASD